MSQLAKTVIATTMLLGGSVVCHSTADAAGYCYSPRYQPATNARPVSNPHTVRKPYVHVVTKYDHYGRPYQVKRVTWRTVTVARPNAYSYR